MNEVIRAVFGRISGGVRAVGKTRMAEQLGIVLLTSGMVVALFSALNYTCSVLHTVLLSLLCVTLVWIVTRRVWAILVLLGAAGVCFGILRLIMLHPVAYGAVTRSLTWLGAYSAVNNLWYILFACLACSALLFGFVRRLQMLPFALALLGVVCACVIIGLHVLLFANRTPVLILLSGGYLILLPGIQFRRKKQLKDGENTVTLAALQLTALPIVALSIAASLLIVPQDASVWKSRALLNMIYDISDLVSYWWGGSAPSRSFELEALGYQPLSDRLGGPIDPQDRPMLEVKTVKPLLLRGAVKDSYSGKGWYDEASLGRFRYDSLMFLSTRTRVFSSELPLMQNKRLKALADEMVQTIELQVKYQNSRNTGIFSAGKVVNLETGKQLQPYFNLQGELFADSAIRGNNRYTITVQMLDRSVPGFDENMAVLEETAEKMSDSNWQEVCDRYLTLPDTLPGSVHITVQAITAGAQTPYQKACAIERWLAENCTYTMTPVVPPIGEDFVAHFLNTKEGYCVYYASAMAVLARSTGLPARYVTGFALERSTAPSYYAATERTAHAWAEVYLKGIGWVVFDPLSFDDGLSPLPEETQSDSSGQSAIGDIPIPNIPMQQGGALTHEIPSGKPTMSFAWLLLPAVIAGMVWLLMRRLLTLPSRYYRLSSVSSRCDDKGMILAEYYADLLRQLNYFELSPYTGETLREFAPRVDRRLLHKQDLFTEATQCYMDYLYGLKQPDAAAVRQAAALHEEIEQGLLNRLGKPMYLASRSLAVLTVRLARKRNT